MVPSSAKESFLLLGLLFLRVRIKGGSCKRRRSEFCLFQDHYHLSSDLQTYFAVALHFFVRIRELYFSWNQVHRRTQVKKLLKNTLYIDTKKIFFVALHNLKHTEDFLLRAQILIRRRYQEINRLQPCMLGGHQEVDEYQWILIDQLMPAFSCSFGLNCGYKNLPPRCAV